MSNKFKTSDGDEYQLFQYKDTPYLEFEFECDWDNWIQLELKEEDLVKMLEVIRGDKI